MELNVYRLPLLLLLIGLVLVTYLSIMPITVNGLNMAILPETSSPRTAVMAAGFAGLGEGWGIQVARKLVNRYGNIGIYALELPSLTNTASIPAVIEPEPEPTTAVVSGKPILIYCTHTTECYIPDEGSNRAEGRPGSILEVAKTMGSELEKQGFAVTVSQDLHDWPEFTASYSQSRRTVQDYLKLHPDAVAVIDVHRDAFPGGGAITAKIGSKKAAPVLLIVGTNQRQEHPHWQENLLLANQIKEQADKDYPGLVRGVRSKAGVYNQDLTPRAMLIEFGTDGNSLEQARTSALAMAQVLTAVLGSDE